tara:strand:+ start:8527 stop:9531 length:1005 start_codon:yes stop_codon:yes gene_type:complete
MSNLGSSWLGTSDATKQRFERAINVGNAGSALLQTFINRTVQQLTLREFGLQAVLPRRAGQGDAEYINRREAGTNGALWLDDVTTVTEETGTYAQVSFPYKSLVTRGKITRKLQATGRTYADILALEMAAKAEDFANALEEGLISANSLGSADANAPAGFLTLIQQVNNFDMSQVVPNAGNTTTPAPITLSKLDEAIDKVKGSAQRGDLVIVGSFAGIRSVNAALQAQQRFNDVVEISAGFRVRTYDGIPLVVSTAIPNNLNFFGSGCIKDTSGAATCLLVLNTRYNYIAELTPTTVLPLSKTSSQFDQFDMYWDGAGVLSNTKGAALITQITA